LVKDLEVEVNFDELLPLLLLRLRLIIVMGVGKDVRVLEAIDTNESRLMLLQESLKGEERSGAAAGGGGGSRRSRKEQEEEEEHEVRGRHR